jgi:hypothetical protein
MTKRSAIVLAMGLLALVVTPRRALADKGYLGLQAAARGAGLRQAVLDLALRAYSCGRTNGYFERPLLTVIDYSLPSVERRLWVLDLARGRVLFHELVAHGENSGENFASAFSNRPGSRQSSLGLFRTEDEYLGQNGDSLRLAGLERGVNDRAEERALVIHGAAYVSAEIASEHGRLGRSWGCPALPLEVHRSVIETIKEGTAVFAYFPDRHWLRQSSFLSCRVERASEVAQVDERPRRRSTRRLRKTAHRARRRAHRQG